MKKQPAKTKRQFEIHFDDTTFFIDNYRICAVHIIPENYSPNTELDFYIDNGNFIFLLRLQNSQKHILEFFPATKISPIPDIVVQKELKEDIHTELAAVLPQISNLDMGSPRKQSYPLKLQ